MLQQSTDSRDTPSPQKPVVSPRPESAWMVNAETQTCASSQPPLWADHQFTFLELRPPANGAKDEQGGESAKPRDQRRSWSKACIFLTVKLMATRAAPSN